jgi:hypothetical protein
MSDNDLFKNIVNKLENLSKIKFSNNEKKLNEDLKNILESIDLIDKKYKEKIKKIENENTSLKQKVSRLENKIDELNFENIKIHDNQDEYVSFNNVLKKNKNCCKCCSII